MAEVKEMAAAEEDACPGVEVGAAGGSSKVGGLLKKLGTSSE